jgi:VWFA-related protein
MRAVPLLLIAAAAAYSQQTDPILTAHSNLVLVPTLVKTKQGAVQFELTATDFLLTDNGVAQQVTVDPDTDTQPLALVICVETGGAGANHIRDYEHLGAMIDALVGGLERQIAVVAFDSAPHLLQPFNPSTDVAADKLTTIERGDSGAAILDGVAFAVAQLKTQPPRYRRAILLISETVDQSSETSLGEALRLISDNNTTLYSFGFHSARAAVSREFSKLGYGHPTEPGPPHGCFSPDGADPEYDGHYSHQVLDCISQLAPPLRLATMAFLTARNGLRTNTAASLAELTGGEFYRFENEKDLRARLVAASHEMLNYYILAFRPSTSTQGPHALHVEIKGRPQLTVKFRTTYWADDPTK